MVEPGNNAFEVSDIFSDQVSAFGQSRLVSDANADETREFRNKQEINTVRNRTKTTS